MEAQHLLSVKTGLCQSLGPQALLDGMSPGLVEPRRVSPIPVCLRVALKKGSLRCVQASPLQLLQMPSKGWEEGKLLHKELDLS